MNTCSRCKKTLEDENFMKNGKMMKTCIRCREKSQSRNVNLEKKREQAKLWRQKNKERISNYNKMNSKKDKEIRTILLRKKIVKGAKSAEEYQKFFSLQECCEKLGLKKPNLCKLLKGELKSTGGYEGKYGEIEIIKAINVKTWKEIKEENNYNQKIVSSQRVLHEIKDGISGKKCCRCQEWKPLDNYNVSQSHWDKLRNDCKECLVKYRKENRSKISKHYCEYEKQRKKVDPEFKLLKTLRSRLGSAIKRQNGTKSNNTLELTSCSLSFLKGYLECKFTEGMTWENHGEWHIDHIKPCCSFNLLDQEEQKKCFHYTNLQPLWGIDNLVKGGK